MRRHRFLYGAAALTFIATFFAAGCQDESPPPVANAVVVPTLAAQVSELVNKTAAADQAQENRQDLSQTPLIEGIPEAWGGAECVTAEGAPFEAESC